MRRRPPHQRVDARRLCGPLKRTPQKGSLKKFDGERAISISIIYYVIRIEEDNDDEKIIMEIHIFFLSFFFWFPPLLFFLFPSVSIVRASIKKTDKKSTTKKRVFTTTRFTRFRLGGVGVLFSLSFSSSLSRAELDESGGGGGGGGCRRRRRVIFRAPKTHSCSSTTSTATNKQTNKQTNKRQSLEIFFSRTTI